VDIRSRANTASGLDFDHMIKREHTGRYEDRIFALNKNLEKLKQIL
jgi:hypothetical protein